MIETDALVIGAGPVGLFLVFQLGLLGVSAHVIDVLDEAGGQCVELYADKPIYDIPALPHCTGRELTQRLLQQVAPFAPGFHFGQLVNAVSSEPDGRWRVTCSSHTSDPSHFLARTVFIAAGVGAFVPKELKLEGLTNHVGRQVFYRRRLSESWAGKNVVIVGGEPMAVANAIALAQAGSQQPTSVTVLHRRDVLQADEDELQRFNALRAGGRIQQRTGWISAVSTRGDRLSGAQITTPEGGTETIDLDILLVCMGISPKIGPLADWGLLMERKQLPVDTARFATNLPAIFAVGDVVTYPGKKKLIVCGFHEATLAAHAAAELLHPGPAGPLLYTSSSTLLQTRLGVLPVPGAIPQRPD